MKTNLSRLRLNRRSAYRALPYLLVLGILGIALAQFRSVSTEALDLFDGKVRVNARQNPSYRGADAAYGGEFAAFVRFMNEHIPDEAAVVLISNPQRPEYNDTFFMQYFLFPRFVLICQSQAIAECLGSIGTRPRSVVHTEIVPDPGAWAERGEHLSFNERMGLWTIEQ